MILIAMRSAEELYNELLVEHEEALATIECLRTTIDELAAKLDIPKELREKVIIKGDTLIQIQYAEISSVQAISGGISIKLNNMTSSFLWTSLKRYQEQLPPLYFKRISKSCVVNTVNIERRVNHCLEMKNGDKFRIGDSYRKCFQSF